MDGGVKSRKLWFAAGTSILIVIASKILPEAVLGEAITGIVSTCAIYVGGNTATRWIGAKSIVGSAIASVTQGSPAAPGQAPAAPVVHKTPLPIKK
jgi:hypothetical protein